MPRYIIRQLPLVHCKRGPQVCDKCRKLNRDQWCLLDISPPHPGEMQRRVVQVTLEGQQVWREYDIVRVFQSPEETQAYAREHGLEDGQAEQAGGHRP